jgi:hypothetical protein
MPDCDNGEIWLDNFSVVAIFLECDMEKGTSKWETLAYIKETLYKKVVSSLNINR